MSGKKKQKTKVQNKALKSPTEGKKETKTAELTEEEILRIKEARIKRDEEPVDEEIVKEDTKFRRVLKSLGYFWDYYKWLVIIPTIIIIIIVTFINTYKRENRDFALRIAIVNESSVFDTLEAIDEQYPEYRNLDITEHPLKIEYDLEYPKVRTTVGSVSQAQVTSMQKFNAMVVGGKVDVVITNTWLLDDYSVNRNITNLNDVFDEEFLEANEDRIYWYISSEDGRIPIGFCVDDNDILTEFANAEPAVIAILDNSERKDEATEFVKWMLTGCSGDLSNWIY